MCAGSLIVGLGYTVLLRRVWPYARMLGPDGARAFWTAHPRLGWCAAFVAWDAVGWLYHWLGHRTRVGWAAHQPHHSGVDFDITLGLRQSWTPVMGLLVHPLMAVGGFSFGQVVVCSAASNLWQLLQHSSAPLRLPAWIESVVMTPATHRHHHGRDCSGRRTAVNLGPVFTFWDRLASTWVPAHIAPPDAFGMAARPSANPVRLELAGWMALLTRASARSRPG